MSTPDFTARLRTLARAQRFLTIAGVITITGLIFLVVALYGDNKATARDVAALQDRVDASRVDRAGLRGDVTSLQDALEAANRKLAASGKPLVQPPPATEALPRSLRYIPIPGPEGPRGPMAPPAKDGTDGTDGLNGVSPPRAKDGVDGVSPPPAKDGTNGTNGKDGSDGKPGRSITSVTCADDGRFVFTFSDDTTTTVGDPGTCKAQPVTPAP